MRAGNLLAGQRLGGLLPSGPRARSRGLRLPEWLACTGIALAGYWPWTPGSSSHLVMVTMCLLPLAVRTLLRWESLAKLPGPPRAVPAPGAQDYRASFDHSLVGLAILEQSEDGVVVVQVNRALREMLGGDPAGRPVTDLVGPDDRDGAAAALAGLVDGGQTAWRGELCLPRLDGDRPRWLHLGLVPLPREDGAPARVSLQATDVTAHRDEEQRLRSLALHDELTGLPNRQLLLDRLTVALAAGERPEPGARRVAVLFCDLDSFKAVNDSAGHAAGDAVLVATAQRLRAAIRPGDTVARLGGDEFVVLCPQVADQNTARLIAGRLASAMTQPFDVAGVAQPLSLSIGVALSWPQCTADQLLARADAAMYSAKRSSRRTSRRGQPVDGASIATSVPAPRRSDDLASTG